MDLGSSIIEVSLTAPAPGMKSFRQERISEMLPTGCWKENPHLLIRYQVSGVILNGKKGMNLRILDKKGWIQKLRHSVKTILRTDCLTSTFLIDRKSTRLNSSHVAISYAVFCLKKKK